MKRHLSDWHTWPYQQRETWGGKFMIEPKHVKAGALTVGAMIVSLAANGDTFATSFLAMLLGAGLIFASQTLWP
jgi:hypothetical protein